MAEFAAINEAFLVDVPDALDLTLAALTEPLSVAIHAMEKVGLRPGKRVVVTGPGPIGLMCAALAQTSGADVLLAGTDADEKARLPIARELGLRTINIEREPLGTSIKDYPQDIWVEASGSTAALNSAISLMPRGGEIVVVAMYSKGLSWSPTVSVRAEHTYHFSYASSFRDYRYALNLLQSGRLGLRSLVACYPLDKAHEAFEAAEKGVVVKPVLLPSSS
jgi:L-iditol 2-dehydrogenase